MTPPPLIVLGHYYRSRSLPTRIRCKAYDQPPPHGWYITTIAPGTFLGPVENFYQSTHFATICVRGYWINVWGLDATGEGVDFAYLVPTAEVQRWIAHGWCH